MKDFQSQVFCFTGVIPGLARADVWRHIEVRDGEWSERMTKEVTILIVGERGVGTGKYEKAVQYGTELMKYTKFLEWINSIPVVDKDAHVRPILEGSAKKYQCGAHVINPMTGEKNPLPWEQGKFELKTKQTHPLTPPYMEGISMDTDEKPETVKPETPLPIEGERSKGQRGYGLKWLGKAVASIAAVFVIISKVLLVTCGVAICVCLWLVGIPATPPR